MKERREKERNILIIFVCCFMSIIIVIPSIIIISVALLSNAPPLVIATVSHPTPPTPTPTSPSPLAKHCEFYDLGGGVDRYVVVFGTTVTATHSTTTTNLYTGGKFTEVQNFTLSGLQDVALLQLTQHGHTQQQQWRLNTIAYNSLFVSALAVNQTSRVVYSAGRLGDNSTLGVYDEVANQNSTIKFQCEPSTMNAMMVHGAFLYLGGSFTKIDNDHDMRHVARWNQVNSSFMKVGDNGTDCEVFSFTLDELNDIIYIACAGPQYVLKWNGTSLISIGAGSTFDRTVQKVLYQAPYLYAAGYFTDGIKRWDGTAWSDMGILDGAGWDLIFYQDELYAVGESFFQKWNGTAWLTVAELDSSAYGLATDSISLFIGGDFSSIDEVTYNAMAGYRCK